ncbi:MULTISPECIES: glutamate racemase [unclassified Gilliamella]|uniref:glutamate racemase n=1 Tax=unclassified Gilliamella TaxID=2685620 RepID=UPI002269CA15|nr:MULTISPECIES: glutamate racemase [unclassified Gilliamella]MCX8582121.1 glutamate racemase [Gilliamella sp. B3482]MCX8597644.1 glutamate racemase [Gilliamella sp. B3493]MCX8600234.1 glutamate racemase [Gilliamella sp. B3486]MCX8690491.1 glutamate racemase [Gilliamella sp. B2973]MCX8706204.1 glutamate racemase [Gilliamella sp. B3127]
MNIVKKTPTVLVFDSGIGGLSIYNEIYNKIPYLRYIYAFDNEMFPYGDKSSEFLIKRVSHIIDTIIESYSIDLAVIACNTASTICLPSLRSKFSFPIVGVVPAIKPASIITKNKCIGLLATKATIQRAYTSNLIKEFAPDCNVKLLGLSELAYIAENKLQGIAVDMQQLEILMQPWLNLPVIPDTIVLGCTHYPFIKDELKLLFPNTTFIDSGNAIASRVYSLLNERFDLKNVTAQSSTDNIVLSTLCNQQVKKLMEKLSKYNLDKYQRISVLDD